MKIYEDITVDQSLIIKLIRLQIVANVCFQERRFKGLDGGVNPASITIVLSFLER